MAMGQHGGKVLCALVVLLSLSSAANAFRTNSRSYVAHYAPDSYDEVPRAYLRRQLAGSEVDYFDREDLDHFSDEDSLFDDSFHEAYEDGDEGALPPAPLPKKAKKVAKKRKPAAKKPSKRKPRPPPVDEAPEQGPETTVKQTEGDADPISYDVSYDTDIASDNMLGVINLPGHPVAKECYSVGTTTDSPANCVNVCNTWNAFSASHSDLGIQPCKAVAYVSSIPAGSNLPPVGCCFPKFSLASLQGQGQKPGVDSYVRRS